MPSSPGKQPLLGSPSPSSSHVGASPQRVDATKLTSLAAECAGAGGKAEAVQVLENAALSLFDVARRGDVMEMVSLLRKFPTIWQSRDTEGCTALHAAASSGAMDMGQLLVRAGAMVREPDNDGWEALHYACANGHYGMAAWLLQSGADLSARTDEGWQPLHVAAHTGQTQLARYLAAQGADLRAQTKTGHEAIHLATDAAAIDFVQWIIRVTGGAAAGEIGRAHV